MVYAEGEEAMAERKRVRGCKGNSAAKPLVLFFGLPEVLRQLRGKRTLREVARGTGLAEEHLRTLEPREPRKWTYKDLPGRPGKIPRLDTLDVLLRYYGLSLAELEERLKSLQARSERA